MKNYLKSDLTIQTDKQFQNLLLYKLIFQNSFLAVQTSKQITSLIFADFLAIISELKNNTETDSHGFNRIRFIAFLD